MFIEVIICSSIWSTQNKHKSSLQFVQSRRSCLTCNYVNVAQSFSIIHIECGIHIFLHTQEHVLNNTIFNGHNLYFIILLAFCWNFLLYDVPVWVVWLIRFIRGGSDSNSLSSLLRTLPIVHCTYNIWGRTIYLHVIHTWQKHKDKCTISHSLCKYNRHVYTCILKMCITLYEAICPNIMKQCTYTLDKSPPYTYYINWIDFWVLNMSIKLNKT